MDSLLKVLNTYLLSGTKIKSLELVKLTDYGLDFKSGCAVIEVVFPYVKDKNSKENIIEEIKFKNYYTESITIKVKVMLFSFSILL